MVVVIFCCFVSFQTFLTSSALYDPSTLSFFHGKNHSEKTLINSTAVHMNTLERIELAALDFGIEYI